MFGFIEYLKTFNHLDISNCSKILCEKDLEKILQGKVITKNPDNKIKLANSIFVVSPYHLDNFQTRTAREYGTDFYWMGHFHKNNSSEIVVANGDGFYSYLLGETHLGENAIQISKSRRIWRGEGHFDVQKFGHSLPLITDVGYQEVYNMIRKNYIDAKTIIR